MEGGMSCSHHPGTESHCNDQYAKDPRAPPPPTFLIKKKSIQVEVAQLVMSLPHSIRT